MQIDWSFLDAVNWAEVAWLSALAFLATLIGEHRLRPFRLGNKKVYSSAMIPFMEIDTHWRTRTIGEAQAKAARTSGRPARNADACRYPMAAVAGSERHEPRDLLGHIPLPCQRCGNATPDHRREAPRQ